MRRARPSRRLRRVPVVFKVLQQTLRADGGVRGVVPLGQPLQGGKSESRCPDRSCSSRRCHQLWAVASGQSGFSRGMQMLRRMIEVQQLRDSRKVGLCQVPDPGAPSPRIKPKVPLIQMPLLQLHATIASRKTRPLLALPQKTAVESDADQTLLPASLHASSDSVGRIGQARDHHAIDG